MRFFVLALCFVFVCLAQTSHPPLAPERPPFETAPSLTAKQRAALIKGDHKKNVDDAAELLKLAESMKTELDKEDPQVISVQTIKQTEDIERLAKSIRNRLKRY